MECVICFERCFKQNSCCLCYVHQGCLDKMMKEECPVCRANNLVKHLLYNVSEQERSSKRIELDKMSQYELITETIIKLQEMDKEMRERDQKMALIRHKIKMFYFYR